jgi:hypothetical protein
MPKADESPKRGRGRPPRFKGDVHDYALRVPAPIWSELRALADEASVSSNDLIVAALRHFLRGPPKANAKFVRAALAALADDQAGT